MGTRLPIYAGLLGLASLVAGTAWANEPRAKVDEADLGRPASELLLLFDGKETRGAEIGDSLAPSVRVALNAWADLARQAGLSVAVPRRAEAIVLGTLDLKTLRELSDVADQTWDLLAPLGGGGAPAAAVALLVFDRDGLHGSPWSQVLAALVAQGRLLRADADRLERSPAGLISYRGDFVLQPGFDEAGDAAAGDDEFRLDNELAHKFAVAQLWSRFGHVPESLRWGLGFVVEQRLFHSVYHLNRTGFVGVTEHFDWPKRAREAIKTLGKTHRDGLPVAAFAADESGAGRLGTPQLVVWAALDLMLAQHPEELRALVAELSTLHDVAARVRSVSRYAGDATATRAVLERYLDTLDAKALDKHLRKLK